MIKIKKPKIKLHNEYDIIVKNSKTLEVEQQVKAYNVSLTNNVEAFLSRNIDYRGWDRWGIKRMNIGRGTGVPAATDVALFNEIGVLTTSLEEYQIDLNLSSATYKVTIGELTWVGETITELGLSSALEYDFNDYTWYLLSHALLKDSEGNPISIGPKTDTQIIDIYATVYIEILSEDAGSGFKYHKENRYNRGIILGPKQIVTNGEGDSYYLYSSVLGPVYQPVGFRKGYTINAANGKTTFTMNRLLSTEGNDIDIVAIDFSDIGYLPFPNALVFPTMSFSDEQIGIGDGSNTEFKLLTGFFVPDTEVIKVDGAIQTRDVDYTIKQGGGQPINYTVPPVPHISVPAIHSKDMIGGEEIPIFVDGSGFSSLGGDPLYIDLGEPKLITKMTLGMAGATNADYSYSNDGINWIDKYQYVVDGRVTFSVDTGGVAYRYWKVQSRSTDDRPVTAVLLYQDEQISFTNPPALDVVITASWDTDVPPKTSDFSYDLELEVDWQ